MIAAAHHGAELVVGDLWQKAQHAVDRHAGIVGEPGGEIGIFEILHRLRQRRVVDL